MKHKLHFIEPGSMEWDVAWGAFSDRSELDARTGEVWQYMGTALQYDGSWLHNFRHRCHPRTQKREYVNVPVSAAFDPIERW